MLVLSNPDVKELIVSLVESSTGRLFQASVALNSNEFWSKVVRARGTFKEFVRLRL